MKIAIIVHSHTGNTLSVAQQLKEKLVANGNSVDLEQVTAVNETPISGRIQLQSIPDATAYDVLVFAAPVHAFSLAPVMKAYLAQLPSLEGKKAACFVTQQFPYPWMGGNRAIKQMLAACQSKGLSVAETGVVNWSRKDRQKNITEVLEGLCRV